MVLDLIGRELKSDDIVVFYNQLYTVLSVQDSIRCPMARIMLLDKSPSTKSQVKRASSMCIVPAEDVTAWKLKKG